MPDVTIPTARIRSSAQALAILAAQLDGGILSYRIGGILDVIQPDADRLGRALEGIIERHVAFDVVPASGGNGQGRKRRTIETPDGGREWDILDRAAYYAEEEALLAGEQTFSLPWLLTEDHIRAIPKYWLPLPPNGRRMPINFAAIRPFMRGDEVRCSKCHGSGIEETVDPAIAGGSEEILAHTRRG